MAKSRYAVEQWHLDKKVPVALITALIIQTAAAIWWASGVEARVKVLEAQLITFAPQPERLARVETKIETVLQNIAELRMWLRPQPNVNK